MSKHLKWDLLIVDAQIASQDGWKSPAPDAERRLQPCNSAAKEGVLPADMCAALIAALRR
jgi:hypothetical protein